MAASDTPVRAAGEASTGRGLLQYLRDVNAELKKAEWPTRAELIRLTQVVLILIAVVAAYCGSLDAVLSLITGKLFGQS
ncbi:MAG: preprotein translocase subunit SecE [Cytophagales bacterium]|nr:preprotein translocase subunit SecE [Armatimonadota bacterium]